MLKQVDTLIGFVVVMAIVSLLITIVTQMVSSFLGLRGSNLADALEVMIHKIAPQMDEEVRKRLIRAVLTHPASSDSILPMIRPFRFLHWFEPKWWQCLTSRWKLASAIRPDELLGLLEELAGVKAMDAKTWFDSFLEQASAHPPASALVQLVTHLAGPGAARRAAVVLRNLQPTARAAWGAVQASQRQPGNTSLSAVADRAYARALLAAAEIAPMKFAAIRFLIAVRNPGQAATVLDALDRAMPNLIATQGVTAVHEIVAAKNVAFTNLEKWFNSAQDRAEQWFAMHTRIITVGASIATAFVLQLDTIQLFKDLSSDTQLRNQLVAMGLSGAFQNQASNVVSAMSGDIVDLATHQTIVQALLAEPQYSNLTNLTANLLQLPAPAPASQVEIALAHSIPNGPLAIAFTNDYQQMILRKRLYGLSAAFGEIVQSAQQGGLQLLPTPYPPIFNKVRPPPHWYWFFSGQWSWPKKRLLGIIISAGLLSLGAPFWFNMLKSLSSLRPMLANEVDKDPGQLPTQRTATQK